MYVKLNESALELFGDLSMGQEAIKTFMDRIPKLDITALADDKARVDEAIQQLQPICWRPDSWL